jgi:MFS family permease
VAVTFIIALVTVGTRNAFGVFVVPMSAEFGWNRATISFAASLGSLVNGLSQPVLGRFVDAYGARRVMLVSLAIFGVGTILLYATFNLMFFVLLFGILLPIASGGASLTTTNAMLSRWFHRQRAMVLSLNTAGASVGALLLVPLAMLLLHLTDWRVTWAVLGVVIVVLTLPLGFVFLRDDPSSMGLLPDGDPLSTAGDPASATSAAPGPLETDSWHLACRSAPFWQITSAYFICGFTTAILNTHFVPYALDQGFSPATAASAFGVLSGLNVFGVLVVGILADRVGRKDLLAWVYAARGCAYALLLLAPGAWSLWSFAVVLGVSYWASAPLTASLTADVYGLKALGTLSGMSFLAHQIGGAASIQFAGVMRDLTGSYTVPFAVAGLLLLPAALAAFAIRERQYSVKYQPVANTIGP